jgi:hypothetical protein
VLKHAGQLSTGLLRPAMLTVKTCVLGAGAVVFGCAALLAIRELHRAAKRRA